MKAPTDNQMKLIKKMEMLLDAVEFKGETIEEASNFISTHMERYKEKQSFVFDMVYNENNY